MKVAMVSLDEIEFGVRRREDYGDIEALATSISERELIQPLSVKIHDGDVPFMLLAGGRRFKAMHWINANAEARGLKPIEQVPVRIYDHELTDYEFRAIELEENLVRKDLVWDEEIAMKQEVHNLRVAQYGKKQAGKRTDLAGIAIDGVEGSDEAAQHSAGWGVKDTAELLGRSPGTISDELKIAAAMQKHPELFAQCKSKKDASKVLTKLKEEAIKQELAKRVATRQNKAGGIMSLADAYVVRDFFQGVAKLPDSSMGFVEIDPPYAIDLAGKKAGGESDLKLQDDYNEVPADTYLDFMEKTFQECYRVMSSHSWLVCWFGPDPWFEPLYNLLIETGFKVSRMPGIWVKSTGQTLQPATRLASGYEMFFYARKGDPVLSQQGRLNVFAYNPVPPARKHHPTERPYALMDEICKTFAPPGTRVLVPFAGSGKTLAAAYKNGMTPLGFDLTASYKDGFIKMLHDGVPV